jgi:anaerobic selenocysteine-containing dehydrogenase
VHLAPPEFLTDVARLELHLDSQVEARMEAQLDRGSDGRSALRRGSLALIGRRELRSNNSWMHNAERLMRGADRCTLLMHPRDAEARGLVQGAVVRVRARVGEVLVPLEVSDEVMPGVVSLPHGFGHRGSGAALRVATQHPGASINDLTDDQRVDALVGTAAFSGVPVEVTAS